MCGICGCGQTDQHADHAHHHHHTHDHEHEHHHEEISTERLIKVEQDLLNKNDRFAAQNRAYFQQHGIFTLNLVSSPGAGKTTLLVSTIRALKDHCSIAVIEGDQQTSHDADRIQAEGVAALQINTGRACHLDAHAVGHAVMDLQ